MRLLDSARRYVLARDERPPAHVNMGGFGFVPHRECLRDAAGHCFRHTPATVGFAFHDCFRSDLISVQRSWRPEPHMAPHICRPRCAIEVEQRSRCSVRQESILIAFPLIEALRAGKRISCIWTKDALNGQPRHYIPQVAPSRASKDWQVLVLPTRRRREPAPTASIRRAQIAPAKSKLKRLTIARATSRLRFPLSFAIRLHRRRRKLYAGIQLGQGKLNVQ